MRADRHTKTQRSADRNTSHRSQGRNNKNDVAAIMTYRRNLYCIFLPFATCRWRWSHKTDRTDRYPPAFCSNFSPQLRRRPWEQPWFHNFQLQSTWCTCGRWQTQFWFRCNRSLPGSSCILSQRLKHAHWSICHANELCKKMLNRSDRDVVWVVGSDGPKESC